MQMFWNRHDRFQYLKYNIMKKKSDLDDKICILF